MSALEVLAHPFRAGRKFWADLGTPDIESDDMVLKRECSEDQLKKLKEGEEPVKFYDIANAASNAGGAGSKKSINKESREQPQIKTTREDKSDDFIR